MKKITFVTCLGFIALWVMGLTIWDFTQEQRIRRLFLSLLSRDAPVSALPADDTFDASDLHYVVDKGVQSKKMEGTVISGMVSDTANKVRGEVADSLIDIREEMEGGVGWSVSGNYIYTTDLTDSTGLGTSSPAEKLDVYGNVKADTSKSDVFVLGGIGMFRMNGDDIEMMDNNTAWTKLSDLVSGGSLFTQVGSTMTSGTTLNWHFGGTGSTTKRLKVSGDLETTGESTLGDSVYITYVVPGYNLKTTSTGAVDTTESGGTFDEERIDIDTLAFKNHDAYIVKGTTGNIKVESSSTSSYLNLLLGGSSWGMLKPGGAAVVVDNNDNIVLQTSPTSDQLILKTDSTIIENYTVAKDSIFVDYLGLGPGDTIVLGSIDGHAVDSFGLTKSASKAWDEPLPNYVEYFDDAQQHKALQLKNFDGDVKRKLNWIDLGFQVEREFEILHRYMRPLYDRVQAIEDSLNIVNTVDANTMVTAPEVDVGERGMTNNALIIYAMLGLLFAGFCYQQWRIVKLKKQNTLLLEKIQL